jgi:archaellum component FlaC
VGFLLVGMSGIITQRAMKAFDDLHARVDNLAAATDASIDVVKTEIGDIKLLFENLHAEHNIFKSRNGAECNLM